MDDIFYVYILFLLEAPKPQRQPRPDRRANRQGDYLLSVDSIKGLKKSIIKSELNLSNFIWYYSQ